MKRLFALFLAFLMLPLPAHADGLLSVLFFPPLRLGEDIPPEAVTDFYYTLDASTDPPHYQRYRFYADGDRRFFFHETREGNSWPLEEEDVTVFGTLELDSAQWEAFCALLWEGTAQRREASADTGDEGPWMYIYFAGGETEGRRFSFASPGLQAAFRTLCEELRDAPPRETDPRPRTLKRFFLSRGGYLVPVSYEILWTGQGYVLSENDGEPRPFAPELADELCRLLEEMGVDAWNGFSESDPRVLDGEMFSFQWTCQDGTSVSASGENAFPPRYHQVLQAIDALLGGR